MQNIDFAWLAGIWDGEGSVYMTTQQKRYMCPTISMENTDPNIISKAYEILNNIGILVHINEFKNKKGSTRPVYRLATANLKYILIFAEKVGPFLQGEKKARLKLLSNFASSRLKRGKGSVYSDEENDIFKNLRSSETTCGTEIKDIVRS